MVISYMLKQGFTCAMADRMSGQIVQPGTVLSVGGGKGRPFLGGKTRFSLR